MKKNAAILSCFKSVTPFILEKDAEYTVGLVRLLSGECTLKEVFYIVARES